MTLAQPQAFFDYVSMTLFPNGMSQRQTDGCRAILGACDQWPIAWAAYGLATPYHETARTMEPIREKGMGDRNHNGEDDWFEKYDVGELALKLGNTPVFDGDGEKWCGRGYCQATGQANYARANRELGERGLLPPGASLLATPDLILHPEIAAHVMVLGMEEGWFTGRKLSDYLPMTVPGNLAQFEQARRIINSLDKAELIASYAASFQSGLIAGGWTP